MNKWIEENRQKWNQYQREHRLEKTNRKYYELYGLTYSQYQKLPFRTELTIKWEYYRRAAKQRNILFNLSKNDFFILTTQQCFYCGEFNNNGKLLNGIDRLEGNKNYEWDNCVSCCKDCNKIKNKFDIDYFLEKIQKINNNLIY